MIPKIIHYCWFGGNPEPELVKKCIASWKRFLPDYELRRWDESNYDITKNAYMHAAYKEKKWAFVSDYCRLDIVHEYGGIYLDTDVEVIKSFDPLLSDKMFCGFEIQDPLMATFNMKIVNEVALGLGFGAEAGHSILKEMLDLYDGLSFYNEDGSLNMIPCPVYQTMIVEKHGLIRNGKTQKLRDISVYSPEYFCPQSNITDKMLCLTDNTYSIHRYSATWQSNRYKTKVRNFFFRYTSFYIADKIACVICLPLKIIKIK